MTIFEQVSVWKRATSHLTRSCNPTWKAKPKWDKSEQNTFCQIRLNEGIEMHWEDMYLMEMIEKKVCFDRVWRYEARRVGGWKEIRKGKLWKMVAERILVPSGATSDQTHSRREEEEDVGKEYEDFNASLDCWLVQWGFKGKRLVKVLQYKYLQHELSSYSMKVFHGFPCLLRHFHSWFKVFKG